MGDFALFEKFKDTKEVSDLLDEIHTLRAFCDNNQYEEMREYIKSLMAKYSVKKHIWIEGVMRSKLSDRQAYVNGELLLLLVGGRLITEYVPDYRGCMTVEEMLSLETLLQYGDIYL